MKRLALLPALYSAAFAQSLAPVASDTPSLYHAECTVSLLGHATFQSLCTSEGMPTQGFNDRRRYVIANAEGVLPMVRIADYVSTSGTANGHMRWNAVLVGSIDFRPLDAAVRFVMTSQAPAWEIRPQNVTLTYLSDGALEILIEEPYADFNGTEPSTAWLARNRESQRLRSHAH